MEEQIELPNSYILNNHTDNGFADQSREEPDESVQDQYDQSVLPSRKHRSKQQPHQQMSELNDSEMLRNDSDLDHDPIVAAARLRNQQYGTSERIDLSDLESGTADDARKKRAFYYD